MNDTGRPLLASYGGGHAAIIAAMAKTLMDAGITPDLLGFTTAFEAFRRKNLPAHSVSALIEGRRTAYDKAAVRAAPYHPARGHPDVSAAQTRDYFAIGLHDLIETRGETAALAALAKTGRAAFEPIATCMAYLRAHRPSVIVTTTSPRFELALIRAGRRLNIPTLAIADLFLQRERPWVLSGDYADHLCVLNAGLRAELLAAAPGQKPQIHATGNPAFDPLATLRQDRGRRDTLRRRLGLGDRSLILWPTAPVERADFTDYRFASAAAVAAVLEPLCAANPHLTYMLRPHPNASHGLPDGAVQGFLDPGLTVEEALLAADVVCFEVSSVGLQAHLAGLPTLCVGCADVVVFPSYAGTKVARDLDDMAAILAATPIPALPRAAPLGQSGATASAQILDLISALHTGQAVPLG